MDLVSNIHLSKLGAALLATLTCISAMAGLSLAAQAAPAVRVITLGTGGGPIPRLQRAESANALVVGDTVYIIDCGDRCLLQLTAANLPLDKVRAIFITHYHQDHVGGLGP